MKTTLEMRFIMSTFIENILGGAAGSVVTVEPDYVVINDGISHAAVDDIHSVAYPDRVYVIYDHDVPTGRPEAASVLKKNLQFAEKYGLRYVQAKGVGYQYMLNEIVKRGDIIAGGGSHSSIFGAKGALGINVSIPELARIAETGRYSIVVPETVYVRLTGSLSEGVNAMDAALAFLKEKPDLKRKSVEIYCPQFSQHEKEVFLSVISLSDAYTASAAEGEVPEGYEFSLAEVRPMVMLPCETREKQNTAEIQPVSECGGISLQAGQIGGYTGGTIEDLRQAASFLKDKTLKRGFRLSICPATSRDYILAAEEGILTQLIDFGAQINAAGDHSVVVQGAGAMGPGEKLVTTGLYTFAGAMGVSDSEVYSASVPTVLGAAVSGMI